MSLRILASINFSDSQQICRLEFGANYFIRSELLLYEEGYTLIDALSDKTRRRIPEVNNAFDQGAESLL